MKAADNNMRLTGGMVAYMYPNAVFIHLQSKQKKTRTPEIVVPFEIRENYGLDKSDYAQQKRVEAGLPEFNKIHMQQKWLCRWG